MTAVQQVIVAACFFALGAAVGSFANVVIHRLPAGRSLLRPGSACPSCGRHIAWYDNVPILAWLWLRGRCRCCGEAISSRYPLVEAVCGLLAAGVFLGASARAGGDLLESHGAVWDLALRLSVALMAAVAGWLAIETRRSGTSSAAGWLAVMPSLAVAMWAVVG